ncbi:hypothetical protein [Pseudorhodoferax soli]|uniref:Uncharacterized protein n=1 Tax=Pseudorhodoferax soli TaxID=545864 RepID=A0A368XE65_9BURK|nr:hypothetical protein [Pseudorhodoferax soli]RCW66252.1 hypothetical protein DES41_111210 [Pseudorhodoferax soli]
MDIDLDTALQAAVNILRDAAESGCMPSGEPLPGRAAELHREAARHLDELRREIAVLAQLRQTPRD